MSQNDSILDTLGNFAILYYFRIPIIILLIILVIGYFKFAVPVNKEYEEETSSFDYSDMWVIDSTTGERVTYDEMNPTRKEIAWSLDDEGHVLPKDKEKIEKLSDELIVKTLGETYRLEEVNEGGNKYYNYYIGSIKMNSFRMADSFTNQVIYGKYREDSKNQIVEGGNDGSN